jgi:hypothetical protein
MSLWFDQAIVKLLLFAGPIATVSTARTSNV